MRYIDLFNKHIKNHILGRNKIHVLSQFLFVSLLSIVVLAGNSAALAPTIIKVCTGSGPAPIYQPIRATITVIMLTGIVGGTVVLIAQLSASAALGTDSQGKDYKDKIQTTLKRVLAVIIIPYVLEFVVPYIANVNIDCLIP